MYAITQRIDFSSLAGDACFDKSSTETVGGEDGNSTWRVLCPCLSCNPVSRPIRMTVFIERTPRDYDE
jgi:hypothetical protein